MKNLARSVDPEHRQVDPEVQETVRAELTEAEIKIEDHSFLLDASGEVPTSIVGLTCGWSFRRAWKYWVAQGPGIPADKAEAFHETWGKVVRVDGSCACPSPLKAAHGFAIGDYHIDTQEGLNAFVGLLKSIYIPGEGERNASMDEATALRIQVKELERENEALRWGISQMTPENRPVFYAK